MKFTLPLLLLSLSGVLHGAVSWPSVDHYTWNFDLGMGSPSSSTSDTLAIQLDPNDKLVAPDMMTIRLYVGDADEPIYSRNWNGQPSGLNGLLVFVENWDVPLAAPWGRLELEMVTGSAELSRLSLTIQNGTAHYAASISPNVRLVPEPGAPLLASIACLLAFRRRRCFHKSPPGLSQ